MVQIYKLGFKFLYGILNQSAIVNRESLFISKLKTILMGYGAYRDECILATRIRQNKFIFNIFPKDQNEPI